jgi:hypothetical protein
MFSKGSAMIWGVLGGLASVGALVWAVFVYVVPPDEHGDKTPTPGGASDFTRPAPGLFTFDIAVNSKIDVFNNQLAVELVDVQRDSAEINVATKSDSCTVRISDGGTQAKIQGGGLQFQISFYEGVPGEKVRLLISTRDRDEVPAGVGACV